jgi:hypothetical protein
MIIGNFLFSFLFFLYFFLLVMYRITAKNYEVCYSRKPSLLAGNRERERLGC